MMKKILLDPHAPRAKKPPFAMGVQIGDTVYVSGHVSQDENGNVVGEGDMTAQTRQVFANIEAVLAESNATMEDVVKITTYITDMSHYAEFNAVRAEVFPNAGMASATVAGVELVLPEYLVEVETIAVIGSGP
ncbi:MAG: RidA family protein [Alphaproteobacteria bacterium]|jgi:reactive intermediate/imine deaminase|nr:RidA family protein [Alphaproteobacteria bacterium]